ncbi:Glycine betaine transporter BetL [Eubacterium callanderi]|uniref:BCCT family transporter n=1 Tax=Eubacterium callanderi TaxID=53442 RepID=UPI0029FF14A6|nr:BCCT family transporter [Eubacterium callanderi]WPK69217.1 Glycine betaine transporter BetL [Eubacterium callanderi]WPK73515.1 Glycine betaine transporter BetL [Eubacterium callanderi]
MKKINIDFKLTVLSVLLVVILGGIIAGFPRQSTEIVEGIFGKMLDNVGAFYLWFGVGAVALCMFIAFSKYGKIRLGENTPQYSKFRYFVMVVSAGLGSATLYWGFLEVVYYYIGPPFGFEACSQDAAEIALAFNMHHYGIVPWSLYAVCALPACYSFYIKGNKQLKISAVCETIIGQKYLKEPVKKLVDLLTLLISIGALTITLGLSVPVISSALVDLLGISSSIFIDIGIVLFIASIFSLTSLVGIEKGLNNLSALNIYLCIFFMVFIFITGPKIFILDNTISSFGKYLQEFVTMCTWMDPIKGGDFPKIWTVFYWAYWLAYAPPMVVFITKISKGQRLKDVIFICVIGGTAGCSLFLSVLGNYSLNLQMTGALDCAAILSNGQGPQLILQILKSLPFPSLSILIYILSSALFMATTMDGFAFSIASITTKKLDPEDNPSTWFRLFWCLILTVLPLVMIYIQAPLNTLKAVALLIGIPFLIIFTAMLISFIRRLKQDFSKKIT